VTARRRVAAATTSLAPLQALVDNPLPPRVPGALIGLIGDRPSTYSRSPQIWGPALRHLGVEATYQPLDVAADRLHAVLDVLRGMAACAGANVTVPYKEEVIVWLDEIEPAAAAAGSVNTIVRRTDGRLVGALTDGIGVVAALLDQEHGPPLLETLYGADVLLIGAGGAARAAATALAGVLGTGELLVTSRDLSRGLKVAERAAACGARSRALGEDQLDEYLPAIRLVINASTRGQAGVRKDSSGWSSMEPYSALAPATPPVLPAASEAEFAAAWAVHASGDVEANHARSRARMRLLPADAVVFDMIYAPAETTTMRHAREAGLRTANGRWMMIVQAAEACVRHICGDVIAARGAAREALRREVIAIMAEAWPVEAGASGEQDAR
jgi:shikimate 5-dehydrogenase